MYPAGELKLLAARKARLEARIGRHRGECVALCRHLVGPLETIDTWRDRLRRIGSYLPVGLALLGLWRRHAKPAEPARESWGGRLSRWAPVVLQGVQLFKK